MLKPLLFLAVTANLFFIATVAARKVRETTSTAISSSFSSESHSSSSSSSSVITSDCDDDRISCGGDPNARPGCDEFCRNRCVDQETPKCSCPVKNSCECKPGYVFDAVTYKCVRPKNCTRTKLCPKPNEVYDGCPAPCPPRRCDVDERLIRCGTPPKPGDKDCKPGCRCADNYKRNDKGVCIKKEECPQYCPGPDEVYDECPPPCPPQRCDVDITVILCAISPEPGDPECEPGCRCIDDYVRNSSGICIPRDQCEPQCPENEEYNECPDKICDALNCSELGFGVNCTLTDNDPCPGKPGCVCKFGYLRNDQGVCIPREQCPTCKGDPNSKPGCGIYCNQRCSDIGKEPQGCILMCYPNACDCKEGYYLDENGKCVLPEECTLQCPVNEEYHECPDKICDPKYCTELGYGVNCTLTDDDPCPGKPGCVCKYGYLRNDKGVCIPQKECPSCRDDPKAEAGCGTYCNQRCSNIGKEPQGCILMCYPNACDCKEGYYLDKNTGKCVLPEECTPQCPVNEEYHECPDKICDPKYCTELGYGVNCTLTDDDPCPGKPGCVCKYGYLRNDKGVCIPQKECPSCRDDPKAEAGCGTYCNQRCSDIGKEPQGCILMCYPNACDCKKGYYLDENTGKCVLPEECTPTCGKNEVYSNCITKGCADKNKCSSLGFDVICDTNDGNCTQGCLCKEGYLRNSKGVCIPKNKCPSCGGDPNAKPGCGVNCGKHCADYFGYPLGCPKICYPNGCDCKKDYYYDDNYKKCVRAKDCSPYCSPKKHEVYSECINGGCQAKNCSQLGKPIPCIKINPDDCIKGCLCEEGYLRAPNGSCIPEDQCNPCTRPNEYFDKCPPNCPLQTCESIGKKVFCPAIIDDPSRCKPACRCKKGYYRNKIGECISKANCLKCRGPHEYYSCGGACDNVCATIKEQNQTNCPIINIKCNEQCYCEKDYARAKNNTCIQISQCYEPQCPINEVYVQCPVGLCRGLTCDQLGNPVNCTQPDPCPEKPKCVCVEGYVRNSSNVCVPVDQCPSCGGDYNATSGCGFCGQYCSDIGKGPVACPAICKINGCQCRKGYYYDQNTKKCVLPKDCTPKCGVNEQYVNCPAGLCRPQNCTQVGFPVSCPATTPDSACPGKPGCVCNDNYARNDKGICIPIKECPSCRGDLNATSGCGYCGHRCSDIGKDGVACPRICEVNGCQCRKGYYYDQNKKQCVLPVDCTPQCGLNEEYSTCPFLLCRPENCTQAGYPIACPGITEDFKCPEKPRCVCKPEYARNDKGICIPINQCTQCRGDPNASPGCGYCGHRCSDVGKGPVICPAICEINGCQCNEGYYYDSNIEKCVLPKQCTPQCKTNEKYETCPSGLCRPQNCTQVGFPISCPDKKPGSKCSDKPACVCIEDYARNDKGVCVPLKECPSCGGDPNAKPGCGVNCGKHCADYFGYPLGCPKICYPNGCDCKKDYYYDDNYKKCVRAKDCSPYCSPKKHEVYSECINGGCQAKNCSQLGKPIPCIKINPDDCIKGCLCEEGYLRAPNGSCIPEDQCNPCTRPNEYFDKCPPNCPLQTCESIGKKVFCPAIIDDPSRCKPACRCKKGYYRNKIGECISKANCLKCRGPHEYYSCGGACDNVCATIKEQNQTNCPIINIKCNEQCYCEKDYARAKNNTCIQISQCYEPQCPINEVYVQCPVGLCRGLTCDQLGNPVNCTQPDPCPEKPKCVCVEGYVRNSSNVCVPVDQCPSCGGDYNATSGCGFCGQYCSDIGKGPVACPAICKINGCQCRKGYYYDQNTKKCVLPKDCTPKCGVNEQYVNCPAGLCRPQNCTQVGFPVSCPATTPDSACPGKPGCVCNDNYARNDKGICIPIKECPSCRGDLNATSGCGYCGHRCSDIGKDGVACPRICEVNGCQCRKGYYYDQNKKQCVLPVDCTPQCGLNEEYSTCPFLLCRPENCTQAGYPIACPGITEDFKCPEKPRCVCKPEYARNDKGICIPINQCTQCRGDPNASPGCGYCGHRCSDVGKGPVICPAICEINGCQCNEGYYYDSNIEKCVLPKQCTPQCKTNEKYETCPSGLCRPQNCTQVGFPINCPDKKPGSKCSDKPACVCIEDYARNDKGVCVPLKECPSCGGDSNAISGCGFCGQLCSDIGRDDVACLAICEANACQCRKGYYYDTNKKKCVLEKDCPKCGLNEEYMKCPANLCRPENCSQVGFQLLCSPIDPDTECPVKPRCVCSHGYARNDKGVCVPLDECPSCGGDVNATAGCGYCGHRCTDIGKKRVICPRIACKFNDCKCKAGYYYDEKLEHCVLATDCPNPCGKNEVISNCVNGGCDKRNCSQLGQPTKCIDPFVCNVGCVCEQGYLRDSNGTCVPIKDCPACGDDPNAQPGCGNHCNRRCSDLGRDPKPCTKECNLDGCDCRDGYYFDDYTGKCVKPENCSCPKPNEVFDLCPLWCPPQTCESLDRAYICPIEYGEEEPCRPSCRCKDGYFRNIKGLCNTEAQCRQCGGPHEYYDCNVACDNVCATLSEQNQTSCPIVNIKCNEMCYCEEGYARAINNTCIPISKCYEPQCEINEQYDQCPTDRCRPENCSQLGYPLDCEDVVTPETGCEVEPKCTCKDGYARNGTGVCIPINECPTCRGDPNAKPGCGFCFTKHCPHHGDGIFCTAICEANGCECKDSYYYDRIQKKCVLIEDCTPTCGDNEIFHNCMEGYCDVKTCGDLGFPVPCPDLTPEQCTKGCLCKPDYVRADNGTCIKKINCPSCGGDINAQSGCGVNCGQRCRDIGKKDPECITICNYNACDCKPGFYLDENTGKCVKPKKCTPQCPTNEIYNTCVQGDCKPKNCSQLGFPLPCLRIDPTECIGGCLCVEGYARAKNGTCIPVKECPSCGGDKNAQSGCGINCGKRCSDIDKEVACIDLCLENACDCKDGYYLNENTGKCVRPKNCPLPCADNEVYNSCVEGYCQPKNCSQVGFPIDCPKKGSYRCTGGCLCKDGFVKADNGTCIPIKQCPSCGGDFNATSGCGVNCNQRCSDIGFEYKEESCIEICYNNSCDCKPGYYLDENIDKCVLPLDCTDVCNQPHEVFDECPPTCPPQKCTSINKKFHCPKQPVNGTNCKPGCRCEKNYFRNLIGECISRKDCLKCTGPHEYFSCDVPCDTECATLDTQSKCNCPIKNKKCTEKCYCEDGYARDSNNTCIPIEDCPNPCTEVTTTTTSEPPALNVTELMLKFRKANIALTGQFVYEMAKSNPGKSFVLSVLSVLIAYLQLFIYSVGVVRQQLSRAIKLDSNDEAKAVARALFEDYGGQQNVTFEMAVKFYFNDKYPLSDRFIEESRDDFKAEGETVDFSKNVEAAKTINDWVANQTHNEIKDLVPAQALSALTRLVLVNALYFRGLFEKPFDVNKTKDGDFYVSPDKTITLPFMHQTATFGYCNYAPINTQILKMDYGGGNFSLIVFLPNERFGLEEVVGKMRDADVVQQMIECLRPVRVNVSMPRYDIASDLDVADLSKKANITNMFEPDSDGFRDILASNEPLYLSAALQKARIKSDEKGTTAAAATAIIVGTTSAAYPPPEIPVFDANHPHIYSIFNKGDPAFAGVFSG